MAPAAPTISDTAPPFSHLLFQTFLPSPHATPPRAMRG